jgi:hypothetical protein
MIRALLEFTVALLIAAPPMGTASSAAYPPKLRVFDERPITFAHSNTINGSKNDPKDGGEYHQPCCSNGALGDIARRQLAQNTVPAKQACQALAESPPFQRTAQPGGLQEQQLDSLYGSVINDTNNACFFQGYLQRFPNGAFADFARERLAELPTHATQTDSLVTPLKDEAAVRRATERHAEFLYWSRVFYSNNPKSFREYLQRYAKGIFAETAKRRLAELAIAQDTAPAKQESPPLAEPPPFQRAPQPGGSDQSSLDLVSWNVIRDTNQADLRYYPQRFANGAFADLARERLAELSTQATLTDSPVPPLKDEAALRRAGERQIEFGYWSRVFYGNNPRSFREYLQQFPKGIFAETARRKLAELPN